MEHLFITAPKANKLWKQFADFTGIKFTGAQLAYVVRM